MRLQSEQRNLKTAKHIFNKIFIYEYRVTQDVEEYNRQMETERQKIHPKLAEIEDLQCTKYFYS